MLLDAVGCCWMLLDVGGCCWMLVDAVECWWMLVDCLDRVPTRMLCFPRILLLWDTFHVLPTYVHLYGHAET